MKTRTPEKIILFPGYTAFGGDRSLETFRKTAELAAKNGFTHVDLGSALTERSRYQLDNNGEYCPGYDFYTEYTAVFADPFKFSCPEKLKEFLPQDYIQKNNEELRKRSEILRELGLKGSLIGAAPQWLPEAVYEKYPSWRGPRCDMPFRSRRAYFAPCVDNEEVLELYRESSRGIGEAAPVIDTIIFMTNDSGTSFCWNPDSYPGQNGPGVCRHRSMKERVRGFAEAVASGLKGDNPLVYNTFNGLWCFTGKLGAHEGNDNPAKIYFARPPQDKPVIYENPLAMLEELEKAFKASADVLVVNVEQPDVTFSEESIYPELTGRFLKQPTDGMMSRTDFMRRLIADCGWENPGHDHLLNAWIHLYRAMDDTTIVRLFYYSVFLYGCMSARFLVRPLVPMPEKLSEEDKAYYRKHMFESLDDPKIELDLISIHGSRNIFLGRTFEEAERSVRCWDSVLFSLKNAESELLAGENAAQQTRKPFFRDIVRRVKMIQCFAENLRNCCEFQAQLERAEQYGFSKLANAEILENIMRRELDNTECMIALLEEPGERPLLPLASSPREEHTFLFGGDLALQLRKKKSLMLRHWRDAQLLFEMKNRFNQI